MKLKKAITILIAVTMLVAAMPLTATAGAGDVVSLGADLTTGQQDQMLNRFGIFRDDADVKLITVSIQDVKEHLEGIATRENIGTKAISSAYVKLLPKGEGLGVETHNVTWVTGEMYINALVTAGVEDADVIVAAPFNVTGTTALTGIMLAFEEATGENLSSAAKDAANQELLITGDMGQSIGKDEAAKLIKNVKEEVIGRNIQTPEDLRQLIIDAAKELNIELTEAQIDQIMDLMEKISKLDLNIDDISTQLGKLGEGIGVIKDTIDDNKGFFQELWEAFISWLRNIFD